MKRELSLLSAVDQPGSDVDSYVTDLDAILATKVCPRFRPALVGSRGLCTCARVCEYANHCFFFFFFFFFSLSLSRFAVSVTACPFCLAH